MKINFNLFRQLRTLFPFVFWIIFLSTLIQTIDAKDIATSPSSKPYGKLPLFFIQNEGQLDRDVKFYEMGTGLSLFFSKSGLSIDLQNGKKAGSRRLIRLVPEHPNQAAELVAGEIQDGKVNYLIGNDPRKWKTNIPTYRVITYKNLFPGTDMKVYGNDGQLEYDLTLYPGADPNLIAFWYDGVNNLNLTQNGDLEITLDHGKMIQKKPLVYQIIQGKKRIVGGKFKLFHNNPSGRFGYGFQVARYDSKNPLIIDPTLVYSSYLGGSGSDVGFGIAVDSSGNAYLTGATSSVNFPTSAAYQSVSQGGGDVFVTKINPSGSGLVYSTYLGGSGDEQGNAIAVDSAGNVYVSGITTSTNFPVTAGSYQSSNQGGIDAFVAKLGPTGSILLYSTYLGGSQNDAEGMGIVQGGLAADNSGHVYITGTTQSSNFPVTASGYQTTLKSYLNGFFAKLDTNASGTASLLYSTFVGGSVADRGFKIAVDNSGYAYIIGETSSPDLFPAGCMGYQPTPFPNLSYSVFVAKFNPALSGSASLLYCTYLAGSDSISGSFPGGIAVDNSGHAYLTGNTISTTFPTTANAYSNIYHGGTDDFVAELDTNVGGTGSLLYSSYFGGSARDYPGYGGIALDSGGKVYVTGQTDSSDFPITPDAFQPVLGGGTAFGGDAYIAKFDFSLSGMASLIYSSYLGGMQDDYGNAITVDNSTSAYITGWTLSSDFPVSAGSFQTTVGGNGSMDAFVARIQFQDTQPPTAPTGLTATPSSPSQINLNWIASSDNVGVTGYLIERCQGSGCSSFAQINSTAATTYADTGLAPVTTYSYRVRATDAAGNLSGYSNIATATTFSNSGPPPTITSLNSGSVLYGVTASRSIKITGTNFVQGAMITVGTLSGTTVYTGSASATATNPYVFYNATSLYFWWPNNSLPAGSYTVTVTNPSGLSASLAGGFTVSAPQPTISSVSPSSVSYGVTASRSIQIRGTNFVKGATITVSTLSGTTVYTGANAATSSSPYVYYSSSYLDFWWPNDSLVPGSYNVTITNPAAAGAASATLAGGFTVSAPQPTISSVSPSSVSYGVTASRSIQIRGTNFVKGATITVSTLSGTTVYTGANAATSSSPYVYYASTYLDFWWPNTSLPKGSYNVTVTNPSVAGGLSVTLPGGFVVN